MKRKLMAQIEDPAQSLVNRSRPAYTVAWIRRHAQQLPIVLSCLDINSISMLHLPAECFIEYQLRAQQFATGKFVATAAYGDGGPWYIPTKKLTHSKAMKSAWLGAVLTWILCLQAQCSSCCKPISAKLRNRLRV